MKTLFTIILIIIIIYYVLKYVGRFLLFKFLKDMNSKMNQTENYSEQKEGEVTIQNKKSKNNQTQNVGEYVDFEEIKR